MVRIKICGITNIEDASAAIDYGADALGFIFFPGSPRYISPEKARDIISLLPPFVTTIGVFANESQKRIEEVMGFAGIDVLQLHGDEGPEMCSVWKRVIRALRVKDFTDLKPLQEWSKVSAFLLDAFSPGQFGGTGQIFNWDIAVEAKRFGKIILSGLNPDNIERAIERVSPYAIDVSSGIEEKRGKKNLQKMRLFIERARSADAALKKA